MSPTVIYLLRHAAVSPSPEYAPDFDWPLNDRGHAQARGLVSHLTRLEIAALFSSPQRRAVDTLSPFARSAGLRVGIEDDLRESRFSTTWTHDFEGHVARYWEDFDHHLPGCESHFSCQRRFVGALRRLARAHPGANLVCSSGGQAIGLTLNHADSSFGFRDWSAIRKPDLFRVLCDGEELSWDRSYSSPPPTAPEDS